MQQLRRPLEVAALQNNINISSNKHLFLLGGIL